MIKPIIAVDIDDVLAQGTEALRVQVNLVTGANLTAEHYQVPGQYWGYYERVWQSHGIADQVDFIELNKQMVTDQSHIPVMNDAFNALSALSSSFKIVIITARDSSWQDATNSWLEQNFAGIFEGVYFAGGKNGSLTKGALCKNLNVSWLIDDNVEHAHTALEEGINVILFGNYGWHLDCEIHGDVIRCDNWQQVKEYFDEQARI